MSSLSSTNRSALEARRSPEPGPSHRSRSRERSPARSHKHVAVPPYRKRKRFSASPVRKRSRAISPIYPPHHDGSQKNSSGQTSHNHMHQSSSDFSKQVVDLMLFNQFSPPQPLSTSFEKPKPEAGDIMATSSSGSTHCEDDLETLNLGLEHHSLRVTVLPSTHVKRTVQLQQGPMIAVDPVTTSTKLKVGHQQLEFG